MRLDAFLIISLTLAATFSWSMPLVDTTRAARSISKDELRLWGGGLWLVAETAGLSLNYLRFRKNYGRRDAIAKLSGVTADSVQLEGRDIYAQLGKGLFAVATVIGMATAVVAYSNAALLPPPKHSHHIRARKGHHELEKRGKIDTAAQVLGVASVGISLLGLPLQIAMYENMQNQHLGFSFSHPFHD
ncbi:hypothetical protein V8E36_005720 [Tilletia maclaganii]